MQTVNQNSDTSKSRPTRTDLSPTFQYGKMHYKQCKNVVFDSQLIEKISPKQTTQKSMKIISDGKRASQDTAKTIEKKDEPNPNPLMLQIP